MTGFDDLFAVGKIVAKAMVGELSDDDVRGARKHDTEPAPPPPSEPMAAPGVVIDYCARCDGEREVAVRGKVVPCPVCAGEAKR